jgi:DNA-binding XRE family transcriptional regulator
MATWDTMACVVRLPRLRYVRERAALTQAELAEMAGVSRATVIAIEAGTTDPVPRTIRALARALKVQPSDLMEPEPRD